MTVSDLWCQSLPPPTQPLAKYLHFVSLKIPLSKLWLGYTIYFRKNGLLLDLLNRVTPSTLIAVVLQRPETFVTLNILFWHKLQKEELEIEQL